MTSRSSRLNKSYKYPFLLDPVGKDYLWGGERLNTEFGKGIDLQPLAETWECSTHPDGISSVASGEYRGLNLSDLIKLHPEILGVRHKDKGQLPVLVKLIDAKQNLSVQVHPSDEYASKNEGGQLGKSEMWYIVDAAPGARIVYGFNRKVNKKIVSDSIDSGLIEKYLHYVPIEKNQIYFIPAGTVHAIGAGALIAEIQENSNLTYRLYDYNRADKNGNKRKLHKEKALAVLDYRSSTGGGQPMRVLRYERGCATEVLCRCAYFEVRRMLVNTEVLRTPLAYQSDGLSFRILMCIDGCGSIRYKNNKKTEIIDFYKGDTIFVPAASVECGIHGKARFLEIRC